MRTLAARARCWASTPSPALTRQGRAHVPPTAPCSRASYPCFVRALTTRVLRARQFARARTRKLALAKDDAAAVAAVEAAYESIMMKQLALRMKGQVTGGFSVSKEVALADRKARRRSCRPFACFWGLLWPARLTRLARLSQDYLPWRPRKAVSSRNDVLLNVAIFALLASWGVLSPSPGVQPMTLGMVAFFFRVNAKMVALFPSPADRDAAKAHEVKRMARTIGLVLGAIAAGIVAVVALPMVVSSTLALPLPAWVLTRQEALVNVATCAAMAIIASFYR